MKLFSGSTSALIPLASSSALTTSREEHRKDAYREIERWLPKEKTETPFSLDKLLDKKKEKANPFEEFLGKRKIKTDLYRSPSATQKTDNYLARFALPLLAPLATLWPGSHWFITAPTLQYIATNIPAYYELSEKPLDECYFQMETEAVLNALEKAKSGILLDSKKIVDAVKLSEQLYSLHSDSATNSKKSSTLRLNGIAQMGRILAALHEDSSEKLSDDDLHNLHEAVRLACNMQLDGCKEAYRVQHAQEWTYLSASIFYQALIFEMGGNWKMADNKYEELWNMAGNKFQDL
ncbi:MAG: hypothetical protein AB7F31_01400 [Parachlamydiales bacterium]